MNIAYDQRSARGFTLVELVVAITVSTVVVGFMAMFIATPIDAYFAQSRRAELSNSADMLVRNIDTDLRQALPNSVRFTTNGTVRALEMLAVVDMARYRVAVPLGNAQNELDFNLIDRDFSTFDKFYKVRHPFSPINHYLVVNNLGILGADAYELANVITPTGRSITIDTSPASVDEDHITLMPGFQFRPRLPIPTTHHIFLVSGPVSYLCDLRAHTLTRYEGYTIARNQSARNTAAKLIGAGATGAIIAHDVNDCLIIPQQGTAQHGELISVQIQLLRNGESLQVFRQVPLEMP